MPRSRRRRRTPRDAKFDGVEAIIGGGYIASDEQVAEFVGHFERRGDPLSFHYIDRYLAERDVCAAWRARGLDPIPYNQQALRDDVELRFQELQAQRPVHERHVPRGPKVERKEVTRR